MRVFAVIAVMSAVHFRSVDYVLQPAGMNIDIGVNIHTPYSADRTFINCNFRRRAKQNDGCEFNGLVNQYFKRVRTYAG